MSNQFVQIGNLAINLDAIESVEFENVTGKTRVSIGFVGNEAPYWLEREAALLFKNWWEHHADVWVIEGLPE